MQFDVTILGSNAAIPAYNRHPSSQVVNYNGNSFLVDCGEGAQFRMQQYAIKRGRLDNVFISHLHGDHFFGLVPLLTSLNLNWREQPLNIYGPQGLKEIIDVHFPKISATLVNQALQIFFKLRQVSGLKKPPSTSELIDWLSLLMADDMPENVLRNHDKSKAIPPLYGALIKNEQDVQLLERLAFMSRR